MADTAKPGEQDQSMEEILQSIRRIIAEEEDQVGAPAQAAPAASDDILELIDPADAPASGDVLGDIGLAIEKPVSVPEVKAADPVPPQPKEESLISDQTAESSANTLKQLMESIPKPERPLSPFPEFRSGETIEALVLEALRPLLKEWLDANLTVLVERLVEREIKKIIPREE